MKFSAAAIARDFSRASATYDAHAEVQRLALSRCAELLSEYTPIRVLDAGCGTGALARIATQWKLAGVDIAPGMCLAANGYHMGVYNADITLLPFADESFDAALSSLVMQWVNNPLPALAELRRVVCQGGWLALSSLGSETLKEWRSVQSAARVSPFLSMDVLALSARDAGWRIVTAESAPYVEWLPHPHALLSALKGLGATNKRADRPRGLTTPRAMQALLNAYAQKHATPRGVPVTWDLYYLLLERT